MNISGQRATVSPLLSAVGVHKRYGAVTALDGADLEVRRGEVMALVGDNGAGKSTLIKTIAGTVSPDSGEFTLDGEAVHLRSATVALDLGIETVYQDLSLVDTLTAVENVFLGRETLRSGLFGSALRLLDGGSMRRRTQEILTDLGAKIPSLDLTVRSLSGGQRQALAIARALLWGRRLVILDEPTAALGVDESAHVIQVIHKLRDSGVSVVMVSHNLAHVFEVADRITVLRMGRTVGVRTKVDANAEEIVGMITGGSAAA